MGRFAHYIGEAGVEALHVRTEELELLRSLVERMTDEMGGEYDLHGDVGDYGVGESPAQVVDVHAFDVSLGQEVVH